MFKRWMTVWGCLIMASCAPRPNPVESAGIEAGNAVFTVATWNIENFHTHFRAFHLSKEAKPLFDVQGEEGKQLLRELRNHNDEDNWEAAQVILDERFAPDILAIPECCTQADLEFFNKRWLDSAYQTVVVFPSNTDRNQHLGLLMKKGFSIVERRDQYHLEKDAVENERGDRLFARGPAFVKISTPTGYQFWLGLNHQKSKSQNTLEATQWRNREAVRTRQIIKELEKAGPDDVMFVGDMNDDLGKDSYEEKAGSGGDTIENLVGPKSDGLSLLTRPLAESGTISYLGYWRTEHRSLIDHMICTTSMKDQVIRLWVFDSPVARLASDHLPVAARIRADR